MALDNGKLVAVPVVSHGHESLLQEQPFGAPPAVIGVNVVTLETPCGLARCISRHGLLTIEAKDISAEVEALRPISIPLARKGLQGRLGETRLRMFRPRFGCRLEDRSVLLEVGSIRWKSVMHSYRHFEIRRCDDDGLVLVDNRGSIRMNAALSPEEVGLALLFDFCGIIQGSSLLNFVTF